MKKCLFMVVILLMTSISFANVGGHSKISPDKSKVFLNLKKINLKQDLEVKDFDCTVSCWVKVYYNGELVKTFYSSSTSTNCVDANTSCVQSVRQKALTYIAAAEEDMNKN